MHVLYSVSRKSCKWGFRMLQVILLKIKALDFDVPVILSFRLPFSTLRFSLKIKSFTKQNVFYRSDIFHEFSVSSF